MTIHMAEGSIFGHSFQALANPVNAKGKAGAGLALKFREHFPDAHRQYVTACAKERIAAGRVAVSRVSNVANPRFIFHVCTKDHWKNPSDIEWIISCMEGLVEACSALEVKTIGIPALGCGLGGLNWDDVYKIIEEQVVDLEDLQAYVFPPQ